ncbi:MAG: hypothetical protein Q4F05_11345 [bacterium]|nr:hypothetical protein [bacterium]
MIVKQSRANCAMLDKNRKREAGGCFQYGCRSNKRYEWSEYNTGWIPCWIASEELLKELKPGRCWMPIVKDVHQMTIDELLK